MKPGTKLKIANTEDAAFLLQPELDSINKGSIYTIHRIDDDQLGKHYTFRSYFDNNGYGPQIYEHDDGTLIFKEIN